MTLKDELIAAIQNEENNFHMNYFVKQGTEHVKIPESCKTASCMAGHIVALRKDLAAKFLPNCMYAFTKTVDYCTLANKIWETEMNEKCTLDFMGYNLDVYSLDDITRQQAIDHINDTGDWPRLGDDSPCY